MKIPRPFSMFGQSGSPSGLRFKDGKLVDRQGNEVKSISLAEFVKQYKATK